MRLMRKLRLAFVLLALGPGCGDPPSSRDGEDADSPRIVSLSPNLTEMLFAIGADESVIGRSSACDYPPGRTAKIPVVGDFGAPDIEILIALRPSLVVATDLLDKRLPQRLAAHGIKYRQIPCRRVEDILAGLQELGEISGQTGPAGELSRQLAEQLEKLRRETCKQEPQPKVYIELWHHPPTSCGGDSFVSQLVQIAGAVNLAGQFADDYFTIDREWVLVGDPDLILCAYMTPGSDSPLAMFSSRPGWDSLRAVRQGRVYALENPDLLLRPGPRMLEGVQQVREILQKSGF